MQIVINISEKTKEFFDSNNCMNDTGWTTHLCELINAFRNGTPLPKGHGKLIDADKIILEATEKMKSPTNHKYMECVIAHMKLADTIIKADGGAE